MSTAFRVVLTGAQETPPNTSTASGIGTVIFDDKALTASYSFRIEGVDFGPVTGGPPQTSATDDDVTRTHFHNQQAGVAGPIVFGQIDPAAQLRQDNDDLTIVPNLDGSWTVSGVWETTDPVNSSGLSIADFAAVLGSAPVNSAVPLYFNVHTSEFGAGEIRGQLVAIADDNDNNPTVDDLFYALGNLDVSAAGVDPDAHYANFGWREGRDPNAFFSTVGYLAANPDVKAAGINPLDHYNQFGWKEGRDPGANFDTSF